jgi:alkaline phosphatase
MNSFSKLLSILALLTWTNFSSAQSKVALSQAHSHNDYDQQVPFSHAYNRGFGAIEADVFLVNNQLFVAHDQDKIRPENTLTAKYLKPLKEGLSQDNARQITLLVDIKGDYRNILPELIPELKPLHEFLKNATSAGRLRVLISGNRPEPAEFKNYPEYICFDEDLMHTYSAEELKRVSQISLRFSNYSSWTGVGPLPERDSIALQTVIHAAHTLNKPIRFWDAPDNPAGWTELIKLGVDIIGTDKIDALASFLENNATLKP